MTAKRNRNCWAAGHILLGVAAVAIPRRLEAVQAEILLPLKRTAYQTNEWIDLAVARRPPGNLAAGEPTLKVRGDDCSDLRFTFLVPGVEASGGGKAKQTIVCALMQGPEEYCAKAEAIAADMFGPVLRAHRVTVEQMAYLEPPLSETAAATCLKAVREAMDEAVARGVSAEAARDFLLGHVHIDLAIFFGELDWGLSAGTQRAIVEAKAQIFQPGWKKVFDPEALREGVARITGKLPR